MGFGKDRIEIIHRSKQRIEPGTLVASTMDFTLTSQALSKVSETSWQTRVGSSRLANVRISQRSDTPVALKPNALVSSPVEKS
jgi:hypothetical protein